MRPRRGLTGLTAGIAALCGALLPVSAMVQADELVTYAVVDEFSIPQALTAAPGDPERGRAVAIHRQKGNCLACHIMPIPEEQFHGETGPDLHGVGSRYEEGELRLRVVNSKVINPDTMMPAFYRTEGLHRVAGKFAGKPMLSAQEVEDVVAYLMTLTEE